MRPRGLRQREMSGPVPEWDVGSPSLTPEISRASRDKPTHRVLVEEDERTTLSRRGGG